MVVQWELEDQRWKMRNGKRLRFAYRRIFTRKSLNTLPNTNCQRQMLPCKAWRSFYPRKSKCYGILLYYYTKEELTWQKHVEMTEEGYLRRGRFRELPTSAICTLTPIPWDGAGSYMRTQGTVLCVANLVTRSISNSEHREFIWRTAYVLTMGGWNVHRPPHKNLSARGNSGGFSLQRPFYRTDSVIYCNQRGE